MRDNALKSLTVCLNHESNRRRGGGGNDIAGLPGRHWERGLALDAGQAWRRRAGFGKVGIPPTSAEAAAGFLP
jgi:hypothetical protein